MARVLESQDCCERVSVPAGVDWIRMRTSDWEAGAWARGRSLPCVLSCCICVTLPYPPVYILLAYSRCCSLASGREAPADEHGTRRPLGQYAWTSSGFRTARAATTAVDMVQWILCKCSSVAGNGIPWPSIVVSDMVMGGGAAFVVRTGRGWMPWVVVRRIRKPCTGLRSCESLIHL